MQALTEVSAHLNLRPGFGHKLVRILLLPGTVEAYRPQALEGLMELLGQASEKGLWDSFPDGLRTTSSRFSEKELGST